MQLTLFILIIAHVLITASPFPGFDVKNGNFWMIFGNFKASNKDPMQKMEKKKILPFAVNFRMCCVITKHTGPFSSWFPMKW